jgi:hypothetical protein
LTVVVGAVIVRPPALIANVMGVSTVEGAATAGAAPNPTTEANAARAAARVTRLDILKLLTNHAHIGRHDGNCVITIRSIHVTNPTYQEKIPGQRG